MRHAFHVGLLLALPLVACGSLPEPEYYVEVPPESQVWTQVAALPAWVSREPAQDALFRCVLESKSNARSVAALPGSSVLGLEHRIRARLTPALGAEDAARAASAGAAAAKLVERAAKDEVLTLQPVPGNTLSTVWTLCEVPVAALLAPLPAERHDAARAALAR
ncbi:MAG: hypothetical protein FJ299_11015 [Planctomycetes bacterium]|nr:hypothetical protein [Planctomycetota bacterium]